MPRGDEVSSEIQPDDSRLPRKAALCDACSPVPQTDSGGREEYSKARERTLVKELGKLTP